jgi:hypothetical protein
MTQTIVASGDSEQSGLTEVIVDAPVPPYSISGEDGEQVPIDPTKCPLGCQLMEPSNNPRWIGGLSVEQEFECECGAITRHTVIYKDKLVHDHFRPGPASGPGAGYSRK